MVSQELCREFVAKHVLLGINNIMHHFITDSKFSDSIVENCLVIPDWKAIAEENGYFESDGEIFLKDNLEAFSTIEEGCQSLGFKEIATPEEDTVVVNTELEEQFDDWSDAAECSRTLVKEEDGCFGAWFLVDSDEETFSNFEECCREKGLWFQSEIMEWWVVDDYLGRLLKKEGEVVFQFLDFSGEHMVWGRTCSGQTIFLDSCIQSIIGKITKP